MIGQFAPLPGIRSYLKRRFGNERPQGGMLSSMPPGFQCSYCGEWNACEVDGSAGTTQQYVEDCQVCCQPNVLTVRFDRAQEEFVVQAQREN